MIKAFFLIVCMSNLAACGGGGENMAPAAGQDTDENKLVAGCFVVNASNPLLGTNSEFLGANWNDPSILKIGARYIMYASADTNFSQDIKIYRLTSTDGVSWSLDPATPVFEKASSPTDWDRKSVETPSVVFFNNLYHLFYTAYPVELSDVLSYKVGHATSPDGITWTRDASYLLEPTNPTGTPNLDFNQFVTAEPGAVVFNNRLYVYFTAIGADSGVGTTLQSIGMISSDDGVNWSAPIQVLQPDQILYPRTSYMGYSTPDAIVINNKVHLFYDVAEDPFKQTKIHHAVSADGETNFVEDNQALFNHSLFAFSVDGINGPSPLLDGTTLNLYFAGHTGFDLSIALATCDLTAD